MKFKKILAVILVSQIILISYGSLVLAKADDLVIKDDGQIVLLMGESGGVTVLGASTSPAATSAPQTNPATSAPAAKPANPSTPAPAAPQKVVPIAPAHTESTVQINPSGNNDKKIQVTIIKGTPAPAAAATNLATKAPATTQPTTTTTLKTQTGAPLATPKPAPTPISFINQPGNTTAVTKTVDQVVEQGANGQPVVSIKSDQNNSVTVQQGPTQVSTSLPIQINSTSHVISIVTPDGNSTKVSVLPTEAVKGATQNGLISNSTGTQTTITQESGGQVVYNVSGDKTGKLLGIFPVNSPVTVQLSAQTGKVIKVTQSPLLNLFGFLIR